MAKNTKEPSASLVDAALRGRIIPSVGSKGRPENIDEVIRSIAGDYIFDDELLEVLEEAFWSLHAYDTPKALQGLCNALTSVAVPLAIEISGRKRYRFAILVVPPLKLASLDIPNLLGYRQGADPSAGKYRFFLMSAKADALGRANPAVEVMPFGMACDLRQLQAGKFSSISFMGQLPKDAQEVMAWHVFTALTCIQALAREKIVLEQNPGAKRMMSVRRPSSSGRGPVYLRIDPQLLAEMKTARASGEIERLLAERTGITYERPFVVAGYVRSNGIEVVTHAKGGSEQQRTIINGFLASKDEVGLQAVLREWDSPQATRPIHVILGRRKPDGSKP